MAYFLTKDKATRIHAKQSAILWAVAGILGLFSTILAVIVGLIGLALGLFDIRFLS